MFSNKSDNSPTKGKRSSGNLAGFTQILKKGKRNYQNQKQPQLMMELGQGRQMLTASNKRPPVHQAKQSIQNLNIQKFKAQHKLSSVTKQTKIQYNEDGVRFKGKKFSQKTPSETENSIEPRSKLSGPTEHIRIKKNKNLTSNSLNNRLPTVENASSSEDSLSINTGEPLTPIGVHHGRLAAPLNTQDEILSPNTAITPTISSASNRVEVP